MSSFNKDPDAVLDYTVDWSDWLGTDTISASTFTAESGLTVDSSTNTTTTTTVWLSDGTVGSAYRVVNHITTVAGREEDKTITIKMKEN
jgi:hypothetical protein